MHSAPAPVSPQPTHLTAMWRASRSAASCISSQPSTRKETSAARPCASQRARVGRQAGGQAGLECGGWPSSNSSIHAVGCALPPAPLSSQPDQAQTMHESARTSGVLGGGPRMRAPGTEATSSYSWRDSAASCASTASQPRPDR